MKVEFWKTEDVKPYENNPRLTEDAVEAVAESIRQFGFRHPIVVGTERVIICSAHLLEGRRETGPGESPARCRQGPDAQADQGLPHRGQQDGRVGGLELRPAADRIAAAVGHGLRPGPARFLGRRAGQAARPGREGPFSQGFVPPFTHNP